MLMKWVSAEWGCVAAAMLAALFRPAAAPAQQEDPEAPPTIDEEKVAVVSPPRSALSHLNKEVERALRDELRGRGFETAPAERTQRALEGPRLEDAQADEEELLLTVGETLGAGLVMTARVVARDWDELLELEVLVARVDKRFVWRCVRNLNEDLPIEDLVFAAQEETGHCLEGLLDEERGSWNDTGRDDAEDLEEDEDDAGRQWEKEWYLGAAGAFVPWGYQRLSFYGTKDGKDTSATPGIAYARSGGYALFFERKKTRYIAAGAVLGYDMLWTHANEPSWSDLEYERLGAARLAVSARFLYPGQWFEPYLKGSFGLAALLPPNKPVNSDAAIQPGVGMTVDLAGGAIVTFPRVGLFAEVGLRLMPWLPGKTERVAHWDVVTGAETILFIGFGVVLTNG
jgi:hypothetical protein